MVLRVRLMNYLLALLQLLTNNLGRAILLGRLYFEIILQSKERREIQQMPLTKVWKT